MAVLARHLNIASLFDILYSVNTLYLFNIAVAETLAPNPAVGKVGLLIISFAIVVDTCPFTAYAAKKVNAQKRHQ